MLRPLIALALLVPTLAQAAERRHSVGSFDRVRVSGPFEVTYTSGSPSARVSGDARVIERVTVQADGSTLTLRMGGAGWGERREAGPTEPIRVTLSSPRLAAVFVNGAGRFSATGVKGGRLDLAASGAGEIAVTDASVDQLSAALTGSGAVKLAGRAGKVRLTTDGPGRIDAEGLRADELTVLMNGAGETRAAARYQANVTNTGLGGVMVIGRPRCVVKAPAGGPVRCGSSEQR